jgi:hypothetical protein
MRKSILLAALGLVFVLTQAETSAQTLGVPKPSQTLPTESTGGLQQSTWSKKAGATSPLFTPVKQVQYAEATLGTPNTAMPTNTTPLLSSDGVMPNYSTTQNGVVYSPWNGGMGTDDCCGPTGGNGPVTYEGYLRTGPSLLSGGGEVTAALKTFGWNVTGGTRTLLFNQAGDAAWALDLGIGYTRHDGRGLSRTTNILASSVKNGAPTDNFTFPNGVRFMNRTSLNFGIGRDYFWNGPGVVAANAYDNVRIGWDVDGRWGTSSMHFQPEGDPTGYRRRQSVYHAVALGSHLNWEIPTGAWTWIVGSRVEWAYNWANMLPPNDGDFREFNILMMFGVRY